jgi:glycosyltransferase involved in cell wall biosynthesis
MRVLVINTLSALRGGGQTYLINILQHFPKSTCKVLLIVNSMNRAVFEKYASEFIEIHEAEWASKSIIHRILWEFFALPVFLKKYKVNVYYAPGGVIGTRTPKGVIGVTALRNMLPFDERERKRFPLFSYIRFKLWILRYVFLQSYKLADKVIFISDYSRSVVKKYLPDIEHKSTVIPHGLNSIFLNANADSLLPSPLKENQFYLYVSILDVYKAQKEIIQVWKTLSDNGFEYPLVLAGPKYNQYGDEVIAMIKDMNLQDKVIYLGQVDYEKLPGLYKSARALLFASSCECCPNILLEKLAAKKLVFCSEIQPMPEFGGDAVVYFDPYEPADLCQKILAVENNPEMLSIMPDRAYAQALKYDWKVTTQKTIDFLLDNSLNS